MKTFLEFMEAMEALRRRCKECGVTSVPDERGQCEACGATEFFPLAQPAARNPMTTHPWYDPATGKITSPGR